MVGDLIMLPVRVGVRATQLWLRAAEETFSVAAGATSRLVGLAASHSSGGADSSSATTSPPDTDERPHTRPAETDAPARDPREDAREVLAAESPSPPAADPAPEPAAPEPVHVSEEPTLVEEFAEPGAEEGAGAEIHVEEPWDGYSEMTAREVASRLAGSTPAALAAVQLYESTHRRRQTILNAVERELRTSNGRGA